MTYFFDQAEPNAAKEAASLVEAHIRDENRRIAIEKDKWITISQTPPHVKVSDKYAMVCDIQFIQQFCPVCHTTEHSLKDCMRKGCRVCGSQYHPDHFCKKKCGCRKRPFHLPEMCPNKPEVAKNVKALPQATLGDFLPVTKSNRQSGYKTHNMFDQANFRDGTEASDKDMGTEDHGMEEEVGQVETTKRPVGSTQSNVPDEGNDANDHDMATDEDDDDDIICQTKNARKSKVHRGDDVRISRTAGSAPSTPIRGGKESKNRSPESSPESPPLARKLRSQPVMPQENRKDGNTQINQITTKGVESPSKNIALKTTLGNTPVSSPTRLPSLFKKGGTTNAIHAGQKANSIDPIGKHGYQPREPPDKGRSLDSTATNRALMNSTEAIDLKKAGVSERTSVNPSAEHPVTNSPKTTHETHPVEATSDLQRSDSLNVSSGSKQQL